MDVSGGFFTQLLFHDPISFNLACDLVLYITFFTITAEILARSLANFYCQQADRHMKFIIYVILTQRARAENLKNRSVTF